MGSVSLTEEVCHTVLLLSRVQSNVVPISPSLGLSRRSAVVWRIRQFDSQLKDVKVHLLSNSSFSAGASLHVRMMKVNELDDMVLRG